MSSIHQHLACVAEEIGVVKKDRTNEGQHFQFRGIDDLLNAVHPILAAQGVNILPAYELVERYERITRNGAVMEFAILRGTFTFTGPEGDSVTVATIGQGADTADKACNKAMSAALKYALVQTFTVPTKDMDDSDAATEEETVAVPPIDVDAAMLIIGKTDEPGLTKMLGTLPHAIASGRISEDDAARLELAIESRKDALEVESA